MEEAQLHHEQETETAIALRPGEDMAAHDYHAQSLEILEYATKRTVTTIDDYNGCTPDLTIISKLKMAMESKKKEYLDPLNTQIKAIRDTYDYLMEPVLKAEKITKDKMLAYTMEQQRIRREQEEINRFRMEAAKKEMELKGELSESVNLVEVVPEAPHITKTEMGTTGQRDNWKWEVIDFALVPDEFKMINAAMLTPTVKSYKDQRTIPGVRIYNEPIIATRAK